MENSKINDHDKQSNRQSGQYIVKEILNTIDRIQEAKPTCTIHIEWVPGHKNIEGNEQADQAEWARRTEPNRTEHLSPCSVRFVFAKSANRTEHALCTVRVRFVKRTRNVCSVRLGSVRFGAVRRAHSGTKKKKKQQHPSPLHPP